MDTIKDIIQRVIAPLAEGKGNSSDVAESWARLAGEKNKTCITGFKEGCLFINVDCSARLVKMNLNKSDYLDAMKSKNPLIKDIRFKVGKIS